MKEPKFENKDFILEMINGMTLYSPHLIEAFKSKALIREVLSLVEMPFKLPENDDELEVVVEEYRKKDLVKQKESEKERAKLLRSQRSDVVIHLKPSSPINRCIQIEIQKRDNNDTIPRALSYLGRELSNDEIGVERIAPKDVYFLFICDYDPFKNSKIVSNGKPIYTFSMKTLALKGFERFKGENQEMDNSPYMTFINTAFPWCTIDSLTEEEKSMMKFSLDMKEPYPNNIYSNVIRELLSHYKDGGTMYDKAAAWFEEEANRYYESHPEELKKVANQKQYEEGEKVGIEKGKINNLVELVKENLLPLNNAIEKSGLSAEEFKKRLKES